MPEVTQLVSAEDSFRTQVWLQNSHHAASGLCKVCLAWLILLEINQVKRGNFWAFKVDNQDLQRHDLFEQHPAGLDVQNATTAFCSEKSQYRRTTLSDAKIIANFLPQRRNAKDKETSLFSVPQEQWRRCFDEGLVWVEGVLKEQFRCPAFYKLNFVLGIEGDNSLEGTRNQGKDLGIALNY